MADDTGTDTPATSTGDDAVINANRNRYGTDEASGTSSRASMSTSTARAMEPVTAAGLDWRKLWPWLLAVLVLLLIVWMLTRRSGGGGAAA